jgi:hypothetical protein
MSDAMTRFIAACVALSMLLLASGCNSRPEGTLTVAATGRLELQHEIYWSHEHMDWDVRVDCLMTGEYGHETLLISAYDNTYRDGLVVNIQLQEFDGDGQYTRTQSQPLEAFSLSLYDDETSTWSLSTAGGGACVFVIEHGGRSGSYDCTDVHGSVTDTHSFDDSHVQGEWLCTGVYWTDSYVSESRL